MASRPRQRPIGEISMADKPMGEPYSRNAQELWYYPGSVFSFLLWFAVVLAIFSLAVWIAYLAR
jgi:hypothetical protein